jgi:hypothetical protein
MMRRAVAALPRKPLTRSYTDYHHFDFPEYTPISYGVPLYWAGLYAFFVYCGMVGNAETDYRGGVFNCWKRKLGTGYQWSDAWPAEGLTTIHKNLPSSAE